MRLTSYYWRLCNKSFCRFWQSTAAYAIATDCGTNDEAALPPVGDPIYEWPVDLVRPTLVVFLKVSEEERVRRILLRCEREGIAINEEEKKMAANRGFRNLCVC